MILSVCPNLSVDKFIHLASLEPGEVNRSLGEEAFPGGKGTHVALAVSELGLNSKLASFWGGPTGEWVRSECIKHDVQCLGPQTEEWTRTCLTILSDSDQSKTEILELGPAVSEVELDELFLTLRVQLPGSDALCVSGSWPAGTPDNVYAELKKLADFADTPLWVDASGEKLNQAAEVHPFGIHINREEAALFFGNDETTEEYARKLLNFCSIAAVTDGANGLFLAKHDTVFHATCHVENIISTVGCGDCLLAGLLVSHSNGGDLLEMARTGTACGAANCVRPELGMLYRYDVIEFEEKVICKEISTGYEHQ